MSGGMKKQESSAVAVGKLTDDQINITKIKKDLEDQIADLKSQVEASESNLKQEQEIKRNLKAERSELMERITLLKKQVESAGVESNV